MYLVGNPRDRLYPIRTAVPAGRGGFHHLSSNPPNSEHIIDRNIDCIHAHLLEMEIARCEVSYYQPDRQH
jgi:hypothetical protein